MFVKITNIEEILPLVDMILQFSSRNVKVWGPMSCTEFSNFEPVTEVQWRFCQQVLIVGLYWDFWNRTTHRKPKCLKPKWLLLYWWPFWHRSCVLHCAIFQSNAGDAVTLHSSIHQYLLLFVCPVLGACCFVHLSILWTRLIYWHCCMADQCSGTAGETAEWDCTGCQENRNCISC